MWRSHLITLIIWSVGTFALALACAMPAVSNAVNDSSSAQWTATVLNPRVLANGIELTVTTAEPSTQPSQPAGGESNRGIKLLVRAVNRTQASATVNFTIRMTSVAPASFAARVMPTPTEIWNDSGSIVLDVGQSKIFTFNTPELQEKRVFTLILSAGDQSIPMLSLTAQKNGAIAEAQ